MIIIPFANFSIIEYSNKLLLSKQQSKHLNKNKNQSLLNLIINYSKKNTPRNLPYNRSSNTNKSEQTSLAKTRLVSKRNTCLSLPFLMICFESQTKNRSCRSTSPSASLLRPSTSRPSSRLKWMASLAFFGTLIITSRASRVSERVSDVSSQHVSKSLSRSWYFVMRWIGLIRYESSEHFNCPFRWIFLY